MKDTTISIEQIKEKYDQKVVSLEKEKRELMDQLDDLRQNLKLNKEMLKTMCLGETMDP